MSMIDRSLDGMAVLSGHLGSVLKRRLREASGIALISLAILATIALATWSVHDPSLSHATNAHVHNWLGVPGAVTADLMMQLLGLGSLALLLPIAIWGYRLLGHRPLSHERLRVFLWVCGTTLTATFASSLPRSAHWPLPNGLGGVVGDAVMKLPAIFMSAPLAGTYRIVIATVIGAAALITFAGAAGLIWPDRRGAEQEDEADDDEDDEERALISLGRIAHGAAQHSGSARASVPPRRAIATAAAQRYHRSLAPPHRAPLRRRSRPACRYRARDRRRGRRRGCRSGAPRRAQTARAEAATAL